MFVANNHATASLRRVGELFFGHHRIPPFAMQKKMRSRAQLALDGHVDSTFTQQAEQLCIMVSGDEPRRGSFGKLLE
jgi:hypothetical protein